MTGGLQCGCTADDQVLLKLCLPVTSVELAT
jgi:hypothetical protein